MNRRMNRVNALLRQEISRVLAVELRDPRISSIIVSVTRIDTSSDLRHAKVFISVLGNEAEKRSTLKALKSASGFIHRSIRQDLVIKSVPFLDFYLDESIEKGAEILEMLDNVAPHPDDGETP